MSKRTALLYVDPQEDFGNKLTGALYVPDGEHVVPEINKLRSAMPSTTPVFVTQDWHPEKHMSFWTNNPGTKVFDNIKLADGSNQTMWPPHCVQKSSGATFLTGLVMQSCDTVVQKGTVTGVDSYSGFASNDGVSERTMLETYLKAKGITHLIIVGLAFEYCVAFTALDAAKCGFQVCVMRSGTKGISAADSAAQEKVMTDTKRIIVVEDVAGALAFAAYA